MPKKEEKDLIIKGLTQEQIDTFVSWFEGQGEQDCVTWFDVNDVESPVADVQRKGGCSERKDENTTIFYLK